MDPTKDEIRGGARLRTFRHAVAGRTVPVALWTPVHDMGPRPLVLIGHGGSGHKLTSLVTDLAMPLVTRHQFAVAAIDGPIHGERRADWNEANPPQGLPIRDAFLALWKTGASVDAMVADWRATIDVLGRLPEIDGGAIGWYGLSMGTAYGLPLVAAEPRIKAAVLGLWGGDFPASERLVADAPAVQCPVLFQQRWDDELFTRQGQIDLFDRIGAPDKRLKVYMGKHGVEPGEQLQDIEAFLVQRLASHHRPRAPVLAALAKVGFMFGDA